MYFGPHSLISHHIYNQFTIIFTVFLATPDGIRLKPQKEDSIWRHSHHSYSKRRNCFSGSRRDMITAQNTIHAEKQCWWLPPRDTPRRVCRLHLKWHPTPDKISENNISGWKPIYTWMSLLASRTREECVHVSDKHFIHKFQEAFFTFCDKWQKLENWVFINVQLFQVSGRVQETATCEPSHSVLILVARREHYWIMFSAISLLWLGVFYFYAIVAFWGLRCWHGWALSNCSQKKRVDDKQGAGICGPQSKNIHTLVWLLVSSWMLKAQHSMHQTVYSSNAICNANSNPNEPNCETQSKGENLPHPCQSLAQISRLRWVWDYIRCK